MRPLAIIDIEPSRQIQRSSIAGRVWQGIGPLPDHGLYEPFCLAVGLWRIGFGTDVASPQMFAGAREGSRSVTGAVVCHDPPDLYALRPEPANSSQQKADSCIFFLVRQDFDIGDAGVIINTDMNTFIAEPSIFAFSIAGHPMPDLVEAGQFFDIKMNEITRFSPFVAVHRADRFQKFELVEAKPFEDQRNGRAGNLEAL